MNTSTTKRCRGWTLAAVLSLTGLAMLSAGAQTTIPVSTQAELDGLPLGTLQANTSLIFEPGDYVIATPIAVAVANLRLMGNPANGPQAVTLTGTLGEIARVLPTGSIALENLTLRGPKGLASQGGGITVNRVLFEGVNEAIQVGGSLSVTPIVLVNSCFFQCTTVINALSAVQVTALQCTFRDSNSIMNSSGMSGGGSFVACLFDPPTPGFDVAGAPGSVQLVGCYPPTAGDSNPAVVIAQPAPLQPGAPSYAPSGWPGKLRQPIQSGMADLPPPVVVTVGTMRNLDFEGEPRSPSLIQVGADEVIGVGTLDRWTALEISNNPVGKGPNLGTDITATVENFELDLAEDFLIIVPQLGQLPALANIASPGPWIKLPFTESITDNRAKARFVAYDTYVGDLLLDGRARVYLFANGRIMDQTGSNFVVSVPPADREFLIDTVPPELAIPAGSTAADINARSFFANANDTLSLSGVNEGFDAFWRPGFADWPWNNATLQDAIDNALPLHIFFNTPKNVPLQFSIQAQFIDLFPQDGNGLDLIAENSGFAVNAPPAATPTGNTVTDYVYAYDDTTRGVAGFQGSTPAELLAATATVTSGVGYSGNVPVLTQTWLLDNIPYGNANNDWNITVQFSATDLAGNNKTFNVPLRIWWIPEIAPMLAVAPNGQETKDPRITWELARGIAPNPAETFPCIPVARFRLFKADDGSNTPTWSAITNWSPWTPERTLNRFAIADATGGTPVTLGDVIDGLPDGERILAVFRMADEAGNMVPPLLADTVSADFSELLGYAFTTWKNGAGDPTATTELDTTVQAEFWWNSVTRGNIRAIEEPLGERRFYNARNIPLPPENDCYKRVEGLFRINLDFPDTYYPPNPTLLMHWELFEDGRKVAQGTTTSNDDDPDALFKPIEFIVPQDILSWNGIVAVASPLGDGKPPAPCAFLNPAPAACGGAYARCGNEAGGDRLGDEGDSPANGGQNRRKDVNYLLVVASGYINLNEKPLDSSCSNCTLDSSPATVSWTVTVSETGAKGEAPVLQSERGIE